jgi:mannose-6-phosphate isomerase-like protein (cupin superfamily)
VRSLRGSAPLTLSRNSHGLAVPRATWLPEQPPTDGSGSTAGTLGRSRVGGANAHYHRRFSESFFVLTGTVKLYDGTGWFDARPHDFAYVPEGGLHGFRNESGEPASLLILFAPGAPREAYFEGLVEMAEGRWKPSQEELQAFSRSTTTSTSRPA